LILIGEGANTNPGRFTPYFGRIKGQAELDLKALAETTPSLRQFSLRLGGVDYNNHPEVIAAMASKNETLSMRLMRQLALPPLRALAPDMLTPTAEIGKFMVDLALSEGEPFAGANVEGDGRIINNKAIRRLVREGILDRHGKSAFD
jgi:hypothetical protein